MKYRKKPIVIEATQWFKNGDHPEDHAPIGIENPTTIDQERYYEYKQIEGRVVRRYNRPDVDSRGACRHCGKEMYSHGWIDTLEAGHNVCPSDWIITGVKGERYPCKDDIFKATYEKAN